MLVTAETRDIDTPAGPMRTYLYWPHEPGRPPRRWPGVPLYSEIFQQTEPIRRLAVQLASHGFVVAVPEVYHSELPAGTVLGYDDPGKERGNALKWAIPLATFDADARALLRALEADPGCDGRLGVMGVCLGGHLAFRAAFDPAVRAAACFYPTDLHTGTLGAGKNADTLTRCGEIKGELLTVWGRQDPHIPFEGRQAIQRALHEAGVHYTWHEFNCEHAFLRDEGPRYNAATAAVALALAVELFRRVL
jgi:carboxymethylenebutenolidase